MAAIKHALKNLFETSYRWNLWGSLFFELLRVFNNLFMLHALSGEAYGIVGSAYATVYFAARMATFGTPYVIAPLFENIKQNFTSFKEIVLKILMVGCLVNATVAGGIVGWHYHSLPSLYPHALILALLVLIETFRIFLRQFLHCAFQSKVTILAEQIPFVIYLLGLLFAFYGTNNFLTPSTIFVCYLIEAIVVLGLLVYIMVAWCRKLPTGTQEQLSDRRYIARLWFSTGLLKTIRELSTNNLLTPLFVVRFGLASAGLFYAASSIAMSLYRIMRATIGNAGLALLAHEKSASMHTKQAAFTAIVTKLVLSLVPFMIISIFLNSTSLLQWLPTSSSFVDGFGIFFIYLAIAIVEFLSIPYEQFYVVEERAFFVFIVRLGECLAFYATFLLMKQVRLTQLLICLCVFKLLFLIVLIIDAYRRWGIAPLLLRRSAEKSTT